MSETPQSTGPQPPKPPESDQTAAPAEKKATRLPVPSFIRRRPESLQPRDIVVAGEYAIVRVQSEMTKEQRDKLLGDPKNFLAHAKEIFPAIFGLAIDNEAKAQMAYDLLDVMEAVIKPGSDENIGKEFGKRVTEETMTFLLPWVRSVLKLNFLNLEIERFWQRRLGRIGPDRLQSYKGDFDLNSEYAAFVNTAQLEKDQKLSISRLVFAQMRSLILTRNGQAVDDMDGNPIKPFGKVWVTHEGFNPKREHVYVLVQIGDQLAKIQIPIADYQPFDHTKYVQFRRFFAGALASAPRTSFQQLDSDQRTEKAFAGKLRASDEEDMIANMANYDAADFKIVLVDKQDNNLTPLQRTQSATDSFTRTGIPIVWRVELEDIEQQKVGSVCRKDSHRSMDGQPASEDFRVCLEEATRENVGLGLLLRHTPDFMNSLWKYKEKYVEKEKVVQAELDAHTTKNFIERLQLLDQHLDAEDGPLRRFKILGQGQETKDVFNQKIDFNLVLSLALLLITRDKDHPHAHFLEVDAAHDRSLVPAPIGIDPELLTALQDQMSTGARSLNEDQLKALAMFYNMTALSRGAARVGYSAPAIMDALSQGDLLQPFLQMSGKVMDGVKTELMTDSILFSFLIPASGQQKHKFLGLFSTAFSKVYPRHTVGAQAESNGKMAVTVKIREKGKPLDDFEAQLKTALEVVSLAFAQLLVTQPQTKPATQDRNNSKASK